MEGKATPSASPKKARTAKRLVVEWLAANGVRRVARDQRATPQAITLFPPYLSTNAPPTKDENMYPHKNDDFNKTTFTNFSLKCPKVTKTFFINYKLTFRLYIYVVLLLESESFQIYLLSTHILKSF